MRPGWTKNTLGDVVLPIESIDPTKAPAKSFRYVDVSSVSNETFEIVESSELAGKDAPSRARRKIRAGDVIFATIRPTLKRVAIVPPELDGDVCSTGYFVFRTKPFLDSRYLFYSLLTDKFFEAMERLQTGASYPAVNDTQVRQQEIVYPSLPEQQRIVAILDEAFAGLAIAAANAEKNLKNARELFESYVDSLFQNKKNKWKNAKLSDVCEKITDGTHQTPKYFERGFIFLSSRNVTSGTIDWENIKYIDEKQHIEMQKRVSPRVGDILLAKNGTTGVAAMVDRDVSFDIYVSLALIRPTSLINSRLLLHFINSPVAKKQFNKRLKGVGVPNLHLQEIREVEIPFPSDLSEQARLVSAIDELRTGYIRLRALYEKKQLGIASLKQSILQKAFSGELTSPPSQAIKEAAE